MGSAGSKIWDSGVAISIVPRGAYKGIKGVPNWEYLYIGCGNLTLPLANP